MKKLALKDSALKNLAMKLLKSVAARSEAAIGLDVGSGSAKMAEVVMRGGKYFLKKVATMDLPEGVFDEGMIADETLLAETLSRMAAQYGFASSQVAVALGGRSLFIREVVFPKMSAAELREAIQWDLEKYVPFSADQLYFDFAVIGPGSTEVEMRVLLVAVPRDIVDAQVRVLRAAGLKPVVIEIAPLAVLRTLPLALDCMLIDLGAEVSMVTLFQKGTPVFTRNIPIGGNRITKLLMEKKNISREEAERFKMSGGLSEESLLADDEGRFLLVDIVGIVHDLAQEVLRTIEYYRVQNRSVSVLHVYLTGGSSQIGTLPEYFAKELNIPVTVHDPLAGLEATSSLNREYLQSIGPRMAIAIGLARRGVAK